MLMCIPLQLVLITIPDGWMGQHVASGRHAAATIQTFCNITESESSPSCHTFFPGCDEPQPRWVRRQLVSEPTRVDGVLIKRRGLARTCWRCRGRTHRTCWRSSRRRRRSRTRRRRRSWIEHDQDPTIAGRRLVPCTQSAVVHRPGHAQQLPCLPPLLHDAGPRGICSCVAAGAVEKADPTRAEKGIKKRCPRIVRV